MLKRGRLTQISKRVGRKATFRCICGVERLFNYYSVRQGDTSSCGCLKKEVLLKRNIPSPDKMLKAGRLTQVGLQVSNKALFLCDCGVLKEISVFRVKVGKTKSCGCYRKDVLSTLKTTHGMRGTPEYSSWRSIKGRCYSPSHISYKNYGVRGISVCEKWVNSFESFIEDMGLKPDNSYSLERLNNEKDYSPQNCVWATPTDQVLNRRKQKNCTSIYRGVFFRKDRKTWTSRISFTKEEIMERQKLYIGSFESEIEAAKAYDSKVIELGIKRHINFPEDYKDQETNILNKIQ